MPVFALTYVRALYSGSIQKTINFAARIVTGLARRDHVTPVLEALGWVRFESMLEKRDEALIRRLLSPDVPPALAQLVQSPAVATQHPRWSLFSVSISVVGGRQTTKRCV